MLLSRSYRWFGVITFKADYLVSLAQKREATSSLLLANSDAQPGRERLRHLVIGSPDGVRATITTLVS